MRRTILFAVLVGLVLSACGVFALAATCTTDGYLELVDDVITRFDDQSSVAEATPRASLPPEIAELQRIRRDTENLEVLDCAADTHDILIAAMDARIDGFTAFLAQDTDATSYLDRANRLIDDWIIAVGELDE